MLSLFADKKLDALLISKPNNIGYLSNFWGSFGRVLLFPSGKKILISHGLYSGTAQKLCDDFNNKNESNHFEYREITKEKCFWDDLCAEFSIRRLGVESDEITLERYSEMKKVFTQCKLVKCTGVLKETRLIKTETEIDFLKTAADIGDKALKKTVECFAEGITEKQLAWIFEKSAKELFGAEGLSFDVIVAFGENSAIPHHSPTDKKLENNMAILIDCGVLYNHYCSDLTRCFWFGEKTGQEFDEWKDTYKKVLSAQKAGIQQMKLGISVSEIDIAARKSMKEDEKYFIHTFGHGVGIDIHESPIVQKKNTETLCEENMVMTAEPGIYYEEKFGIRIEDLLVIRQNGAEFLSKSNYFFDA